MFEFFSTLIGTKTMKKKKLKLPNLMVPASHEFYKSKEIVVQYDCFKLQ